MSGRDSLIYHVAEVAGLLRLSRGATYEAIRRGQIPSVRIGRRILVPRLALEKLLQRDGTVGTDDTAQNQAEGEQKC